MTRKTKPDSPRVWVLATIAVMAALILLYWSATRNPPPADRITVAYVDFAGEAPSIIAYTRGFFREEALEVDFKRHETGVRSLASLRQGQTDIATVTEFPVVRAALEEANSPGVGARFLVIGDTVYSYRSHQVIARSDRGIRTAADLKGRKVGIPAGMTSVDYFLGNMLRQQGIAETDVEVIPLELGSLAPALEKGDIDAFLAWEPFISRAQARLGERSLVFPGNPLFSTSWVIVVNERFAKSKPELLPKYLRAIMKGERFVQERPDEAMEVVARHTGIEREIVARTFHLLDFRLSLSQALVAAMEEEARWLIGGKRTSATEVPNFLDYIHVEPLKKVNPATVTLIK